MQIVLYSTYIKKSTCTEYRTLVYCTIVDYVGYCSPVLCTVDYFENANPVAMYFFGSFSRSDDQSLCAFDY